MAKEVEMIKYMRKNKYTCFTASSGISTVASCFCSNPKGTDASGGSSLVVAPPFYKTKINEKMRT